MAPFVVESAAVAFPVHGSSASGTLGRVQGWMGQPWRGQGSPEAASVRSQVSALLACARGVVGGWRGNWGSGTLLQPPEDLGSPFLLPAHPAAITASAPCGHAAGRRSPQTPRASGAEVLVPRPEGGSQSNGTINNDPLEVVVFTGLSLESTPYVLKREPLGRRCGRKPVLRIKSDTKRRKYQGFMSTICVDEDLRFLPHFCSLTHGSTFFAPLLREPQKALGSPTP